MNRAVFLDRDGVIFRAVVRDGRPYPPGCEDEVEYLPGVAEAMDALHQAGYRLIVVTNQPDVATGMQRRDVVEGMHARMREMFPIDDVKVCYHVDNDRCDCRKPKAGMLLEAAEEWGLDLSRCFMIGDRWRDIAAGKTAGCHTILIRANYEEREAENPDRVVDSLIEASNFILSHSVQGGPRKAGRL
jgi:D-glycero-D-manno-heptose 1,7-bisphosphate phosphatase